MSPPQSFNDNLLHVALLIAGRRPVMRSAAVTSALVKLYCLASHKKIRGYHLRTQNGFSGTQEAVLATI